MAEWKPAPATDESPDHSTCKTCKKPISWDEVCYTHDDSGFADCGLVVKGGLILTEAQLTGSVRASRLQELRVNPQMIQTARYPPGSMARPVTWDD